jgi:hypothetical protein
MAELDPVMDAATRFAAYCERNHSAKIFTRRWCDMVAPARTMREPDFVAPRTVPSAEASLEILQLKCAITNGFGAVGGENGNERPSVRYGRMAANDTLGVAM